MSLIPYDDDIFGIPSDFFSPTGVFKNSIRVDVLEHESSYEVIADIPAGVSKSDIKLEFDSGYLTLNVSVKGDSCSSKKSCRHVLKERFRGQYSRRIYVADGLDRDGIKASYVDCVLKVIIPKLPEKGSSSKLIDIE